MIRKRWLLLGCGGTILLVLLLFCAGTGYVYRLWNRPPEGWRQVMAMREATPPQKRRELAVALENRLTRELSFSRERADAYHRPGTPPTGTTAADGSGAIVKTVEVTTEELNAWLDERLGEWASNQGLNLPAGLSDVAVWIEDGQPVIAADVQFEGVAQVVSVKLDPELLANGEARIDVSSIRAGQLPIPLSRLKEQVMARVPAGRRAEAEEAIGKLDGQPFPPVVEHASQRLRLKGLKITDQSVAMTIEAQEAARK